MNAVFDSIEAWRPSQAAYDTFRDDSDLPARKVAHCTLWERVDIVERYYFRLSGCVTLAAANKPCAMYVLLDIALQSDAREARKCVQRAFGQKETGEWSEWLIDRLASHDDHALAAKLEAHRPHPNPPTRDETPVD